MKKTEPELTSNCIITLYHAGSYSRPPIMIRLKSEDGLGWSGFRIGMDETGLTEGALQEFPRSEWNDKQPINYLGD